MKTTQQMDSVKITVFFGEHALADMVDSYNTGNVKTASQAPFSIVIMTFPTHHYFVYELEYNLYHQFIYLTDALKYLIKVTKEANKTATT